MVLNVVAPVCVFDMCLKCVNVCVLQGKCDAITAVKLLSCFDDLVAVGTASGRVSVFQLVSPLPGRNKQVRGSTGVFQARPTLMWIFCQTILAWHACLSICFALEGKYQLKKNPQ